MRVDLDIRRRAAALCWIELGQSTLGAILIQVKRLVWEFAKISFHDSYRGSSAASAGSIPQVHLEFKTGLSCELLATYDAGSLDVLIAKKDGIAQRGRVIWREPLVWMAAGDYKPDFTKPAPLVLLPPPCTYREVMVQALSTFRMFGTLV